MPNTRNTDKKSKSNRSMLPGKSNDISLQEQYVGGLVLTQTAEFVVGAPDLIKLYLPSPKTVVQVLKDMTSFQAF